MGQRRILHGDLITLLVILFVVSFAPSATVAATTAAEADASKHAYRAKVLTLFRAGDFAGLERQIAVAEEAYRSGATSDLAVEHAYYAFGAMDARFPDQFDAWEAAYPESHRPHLARGIHARFLGWSFRGGAYAKNTADQRITMMRDSFAVALRSLNRALAIEPKSGVAYSFMIDIHKAIGARDELERLLKEGLAADPRSYSIRRRYAESLVPWWGGADLSAETLLQSLINKLPGLGDDAYPVAVPDRLRAFIAEVAKDSEAVPSLRPLQGFVDFVVARMLEQEGRREEAIEYHRRARQFGEYWWYHYREGLNYYYMNRYPEAVTRYDKALAAWPANPMTLVARAQAKRQMEDYEGALRDVDQALSFDPSNPDNLVEKVYNLRPLGRYDEALSALDDARHYGDLEDRVWDARGRLYLYELKNPTAGMESLRRATELKPRRSSYWYNYGLALYQTHDCKAVEVYRRYLETCKGQGGRCSAKSKKYAGDVIEYLLHSKICPA